MNVDKDVLTTGEVAKICNVAARTVSKWFDSGQLKGYRIPGSKDRRIPLGNLIKFMKDHHIPTDGLMSGEPRVLIVDQDQDVLASLKGILGEQTKYQVRTCASAFEAGVECERFRPHVMLMDLHLTDADSKRICDVMRGDDDLLLTRVIGMSAKLTEGQAAQLLGGGFHGVLRKPFTVRQVIDSIEAANSLVS
jgi:excisionase family DNA binding protein